MSHFCIVAVPASKRVVYIKFIGCIWTSVQNVLGNWAL